MTNQHADTFRCNKFDSVFMSKMESICNSIATAGFDPYSQLTGYLLTGEDCYITRTGNARALIHDLDRSALQAYVKLYLEK